uniref:hypothetical protein n=1 Tax=Mycoplasmopsis primatum TaxID=55604 RepID=UPI00056A9FA4
VKDNSLVVEFKIVKDGKQSNTRTVTITGFKEAKPIPSVELDNNLIGQAQTIIKYLEKEIENDLTCWTGFKNEISKKLSEYKTNTNTQSEQNLVNIIDKYNSEKDEFYDLFMGENGVYTLETSIDELIAKSSNSKRFFTAIPSLKSHYITTIQEMIKTLELLYDLQEAKTQVANIFTSIQNDILLTQTTESGELINKLNSFRNRQAKAEKYRYVSGKNAEGKDVYTDIVPNAKTIFEDAYLSINGKITIATSYNEIKSIINSEEFKNFDKKFTAFDEYAGSVNRSINLKANHKDLYPFISQLEEYKTLDKLLTESLEFLKNFNNFDIDFSTQANSFSEALKTYTSIFIYTDSSGELLEFSTLSNSTKLISLYLRSKDLLRTVESYIRYLNTNAESNSAKLIETNKLKAEIESKINEVKTHQDVISVNLDEFKVQYDGWFKTLDDIKNAVNTSVQGSSYRKLSSTFETYFKADEDTQQPAFYELITTDYADVFTDEQKNTIKTKLDELKKALNNQYSLAKIPGTDRSDYSPITQKVYPILQAINSIIVSKFKEILTSEWSEILKKQLKSNFDAFVAKQKKDNKPNKIGLISNSAFDYIAFGYYGKKLRVVSLLDNKGKITTKTGKFLKDFHRIIGLSTNVKYVFNGFMGNKEYKPAPVNPTPEEKAEYEKYEIANEYKSGYGSNQLDYEYTYDSNNEINGIKIKVYLLDNSRRLSKDETWAFYLHDEQPIELVVNKSELKV